MFGILKNKKATEQKWKTVQVKDATTEELEMHYIILHGAPEKNCESVWGKEYKQYLLSNKIASISIPQKG